MAGSRSGSSYAGSRDVACAALRTHRPRVSPSETTGGSSRRSRAPSAAGQAGLRSNQSIVHLTPAKAHARFAETPKCALAAITVLPAITLERVRRWFGPRRRAGSVGWHPLDALSTRRLRR